ncbi:MAG: ATP-binding protein [Methanobrevibacter sp.]|jgi:predicted ATPase|nr:ATP-binding protein [Candidatus Methanovirga aequatorialis]
MIKINKFKVINKADIEFGLINIEKTTKGSINIIAGNNSSGKTTLSKCLYSVLGSLSNESYEIYETELKRLYYRLDADIFRFIRSHRKYEKDSQQNNLFGDNDSQKLFDDLILELNNLRRELSKITHNLDYGTNEISSVIEKIKDIFQHNNVQDYKIEKSIENTLNGLKTKENKIKRSEEIIQMLFNKEFGETYNDFFNNNISLFSTKNLNDPLLSLSSSNMYNDSLTDLVIGDIYYFETPFILDFFNNCNSPFGRKCEFETYHQSSLVKKLSQKPFEWQFNTDSRVENPKKILSGIISGNLHFDNKKGFMFKNNQGDFIIKNTAAGVKSIAMLLSLFDDLDDNSFLIMDEPEVHLHPLWQIKLAEAIVVMAKIRKIHFHINSHSPQFIEAIDTYGNFYDLDNIRYYLAKENGENTFNIEEILQADLVEIYNHFGDPYDELDRVRAKTRVKNATKDD